MGVVIAWDHRLICRTSVVGNLGRFGFHMHFADCLEKTLDVFLGVRVCLSQSELLPYAGANYWDRPWLTNHPGETCKVQRLRCHYRCILYVCYVYVLYLFVIYIYITLHMQM